MKCSTTGGQPMKRGGSQSLQKNLVKSAFPNATIRIATITDCSNNNRIAKHTNATSFVRLSHIVSERRVRGKEWSMHPVLCY